MSSVGSPYHVAEVVTAAAAPLLEADLAVRAVVTLQAFAEDLGGKESYFIHLAVLQYDVQHASIRTLVCVNRFLLHLQSEFAQLFRKWLCKLGKINHEAQH